MATKGLPIGYLKCMECGRPALWLMDSIKYTPQAGKNIAVHVKYNLINLKELGYDPEAVEYFLCDGCGCRVSPGNYVEEYVVFLGDSEGNETMH